MDFAVYFENSMEEILLNPFWLPILGFLILLACGLKVLQDCLFVSERKISAAAASDAVGVFDFDF